VKERFFKAGVHLFLFEKLAALGYRKPPRAPDFAYDRILGWCAS
jgi:hypothetical protein